jgi:hypothetical protein
VAVTNREGVLTSEPTIRKRQSGGDHRVAVVELSRKLQINPGSSVAGLGAPPDVRLDLTDDITLVTDPSTTDAVLAFAPTTRAQRRRMCRVAWIAYPKAGQLGSASGPSDRHRLRLVDAAVSVE